MPRPRVHALDDLFDIAEDLVTRDGTSGLTLRALATAAGASNGTIYHAFGSKEDLLARLWLRAASRLGTIANDALAATDVLDAGTGDDLARRTVVAVALSPVTFARSHRKSAELFFAQRRDQLFSTELSTEVVDELTATQERFTARLISLAERMWGRADRLAVDAIAACVADIPGGLLRRPLLEGRDIDTAAERRIEAAVLGILAVPPPTPEPRPSKSRRS